jgi:hypothetical protein
MEYTWKISGLDCYPQFDGETDVVFTAYWTVIGTNGNYSGNAYGSVGIPVTEKAGFTPYADLTQEQVLNWCWANGVNKDAVEANIEKQVQDQITPPVVSLPLPWAVPAPI